MVRRNKWGFAAAAAVLRSLVLGTAVASWQAVRAMRLGKQATADERAARQAPRQAEREKEEATDWAYVANMNLAQAAWEQNNVGEVRQLLHQTAVCSRRGFEWYDWQRQTHLEIETLKGHTRAVYSVAFSPDGRRILTGSWDKTAKV
jgi:WD domain, G-beta repeat